MEEKKRNARRAFESEKNSALFFCNKQSRSSSPSALSAAGSASTPRFSRESENAKRRSLSRPLNVERRRPIAEKETSNDMVSVLNHFFIIISFMK
jgi:hypothetical protein